MSAVIISLADARKRRIAQYLPVTSEDREVDGFIADAYILMQRDIANREIAQKLVGFARRRIAEAQARAQRSIAGGIPHIEAIRRAIAWARCSFDPFPPSVA